jgi:hypothetical protein
MQLDTPRVVERKDVSIERRNELFRQLFKSEIANVKWQRQTLEMDFDGECVAFVRTLADKALNDSSGSIQEFLQDNPLPPYMLDLKLNDAERACFLVMNALKQWFSKESIYMDTMFTGGQFRKKLKSLAIGRKCPGCEKTLDNTNLEFHHTHRDGRPPIPICHDCHKKIESRKANGSQNEEDSPTMLIPIQVSSVSGTVPDFTLGQLPVRCS